MGEGVRVTAVPFKGIKDLTNLSKHFIKFEVVVKNT